MCVLALLVQLPEAVEWFATTIAAFLGSEPVQKRVFGTSMEFLDAILKVSKFATTSESVNRLCKLMAKLIAEPQSRATFATAEVCDALVAMAEYADTAESVESVSNVINMIAEDPAITSRKAFATHRVRDTLLDFSRKVAEGTTPQRFDVVAITLSNVATLPDDGVQTTFGTETVRDALIGMVPHAVTAASVARIAVVIGTLTTNDANAKKVFSTETVRDALVRMSKYATTADSVLHITTAIRNITSDNAFKKLYGTAAVRDAILYMSQHASSKDARDMCMKLLVKLKF
jgi:hypothetical protein